MPFPNSNSYNDVQSDFLTFHMNGSPISFEFTLHHDVKTIIDLACCVALTVPHRKSDPWTRSKFSETSGVAWRSEHVKS